jgi:hypothetical protein
MANSAGAMYVRIAVLAVAGYECAQLPLCPPGAGSLIPRAATSARFRTSTKCTPTVRTSATDASRGRASACGTLASLISRCAAHAPLSALLFALLRYVSIATLAVENYGYFSHGFTESSCRIQYFVPIGLRGASPAPSPLFSLLIKVDGRAVTQSMISLIIIGLRTYSIAHHSRTVRNFLGTLFLLVSGAMWFVTFYARTPVLANGTCTASSLNARIEWLFYVWIIVFDFAAVAISTLYLARVGSKSRRVRGPVPSVVKGMLCDGLGFLIVLTGVNAFNLVDSYPSASGEHPLGLTAGVLFTWVRASARPMRRR